MELKINNERVSTNKISIVIPAFNAEKYIGKSIKSIIEQSVSIKEVLVINDCSQDQTVNIVEKNSGDFPTIRVVNLTKNKGVSNARNVGSELVSSDWILFLDADDFLHPCIHERYQQILTQADNLDDYVLGYCKVQEVNADGELMPSVFEGFQMEKSDAFGHEILRNRIFPSGTIVRKTAFIEAGGFDPTMTHAEDWDFWLRLSRLGGFLYLPEISAYIRRHDLNASKRIESMLIGERKVLNKYSIWEIKEGIFNRSLSFEENQIDFLFLLLRLEEWDECRNELAKLDLNNTDNIKLLFLYSLLEIHNNNLNKSEEVLRGILEINSSYPEAMNNLGGLLLLKKKKKESAELFLSALNVHNNYMDAQHNYQLSLNETEFVTKQDVKFTWRVLRKSLTTY